MRDESMYKRDIIYKEARRSNHHELGGDGGAAVGSGNHDVIDAGADAPTGGVTHVPPEGASHGCPGGNELRPGTDNLHICSICQTTDGDHAVEFGTYGVGIDLDLIF